MLYTYPDVHSVIGNIFSSHFFLWEKRNLIINQSINKIDSIINIIRVRVDACDRLWGVDTGVDDILGNNTVIHQPRIIIIDLKTDKVE